MVNRSQPVSRSRTGRGRRVLRGAAFTLLLLVVAVVATLGGIYVGIPHAVPPLDLSAEATSTAQTTKIFDNAQEPILLAELHGVENRESLSGDRIPQVMRDAVVAVEDERFYEHEGVDFFGILRAMWTNIRKGGMVQGGSTITQQYIENAFINDATTVDRKLREAAFAYQLERQWSKEKILNEYLNIVYFGEGAYGVEAAAREYFGVHAIDLRPDQAALLAGLLKAPSTYSPRRDPETAMSRRDIVLTKMQQQGYITDEQLQEALATPLQLADKATGDETRVPYWIEMVREQLVDRYGSNTVLSGGLRVYLSIDLALQEAAEKAVTGVLTEAGDPSAAVVCIDARTGRLLAMVGGQDFSKLQFNLATQGRRQPGSAFKTFVLTTALNEGISPDATYTSGPANIELPGGVWKVSSTDEGPISLRRATAASSNGVYARLIMDLGADEVAGTAYDMGIQTSLGDDPNPAIALGGLTTGVSPLEMAMAYTTLATGGERLEATAFNAGGAEAAYPVVIERVTDSKGTVLEENDVKRTRVLDEGVAAVVTNLLQGVISKGTGTAADIGRPAAGKTGTTSNYRDAWFVGYTPELVTAVWVGYPDAQKAMTDVHGIKVTGGSLPAKIWAAFMKQAVKDIPVSSFAQPPEGEWVSKKVCSESHQLPTEFCPQTRQMLFRADRVPTEECELHKAEEIPVPNVVGSTLEEATKILQEAKFKVTTIEDSQAWGPAGMVTGQDPAAGTPFLQGETVTLSVSVGMTGRLLMPSVTGFDIGEATAYLEGLGLEVDDTAIDSDAPEGTIISQSIPAGTPVEPGRRVELVYSTGPGSQPTSTSPGDNGEERRDGNGNGRGR